MIIKADNDLLFIHIPKCAGTSIERYFGAPSKLADCAVSDYDCLLGRDESKAEDNYWMQHASLKEMQLDYNIQIEDFIKFAVVRNPYDRFISSYAYECKFFKCRMHYNEFAKKMPHVNPQHKRTQLSFLKDKDGNVNVDHILRFENLDEDFTAFLDHVGIEPLQQLGVANKVRHKHYTQCYDDELMELVTDMYWEDIDYFGYEFAL